MRSRAVAAVASAVMVMSVGVANAHPGESDGSAGHGGGEDGHVPANTNYGFEPVGHSALSGIQDGRYTDVWAHEGYAYIGSFQDPDCSRAGVYIADLSDPTSPTYIGDIKSPPNTRVNDVKVTDVGDRDVLIFSLEKCGKSVSSGQLGQGGISLWDVTDPTNPHALKQNFLDFQVHNTYPWTTEEGNTYALVVDDENTDDLHVVDLTKPQSPQHIAQTGIGTWLEDGYFDQDTSQLFTGVFAASLLHDVWVEFNPTTERWEGVLSYWDAGFITVDLTDPSNPTIIDDSDYLADDPVLGDLVEQPEGNAHAAVFGGDDNEFIFGGDEDFDVLATKVTVGSESFGATTGSDTPAPTQEGTTGTPVYVGLACNESSVPQASDPSDIALIVRGACAFTTKATSVTAKGYAAGIVFNQDAATRCEASVSMLVEGSIPMVFVPRSAGFAILGQPYDGSTCGDGSTDSQLPEPGTAGATDATISAVFDGWGYFWGINNSGDTMTVPDMAKGQTPTRRVDPMGTVGYYAPGEVADPALAQGSGDLTMHNLETDIDANDPKARERTFISWYALGMRAVEWRPGHYHAGGDANVHAWNFHEVGRWIASADDPFVAEAAEAAGVSPSRMEGSDFWGVTQTVIDGTRYVLGSDRNTGLWVFEWSCEDASSSLYCNGPVTP